MILEIQDENIKEILEENFRIIYRVVNENRNKLFFRHQKRGFIML